MDQFQRMFVQFLILFAQKALAKLSKTEQSVARLCSEKDRKNEQKRPDF
jgi:hypothetical protein